MRALGAALLLCGTFVGVTVSMLALAAIGVDVGFLVPTDGETAGWFLAPSLMTTSAWRDVLSMRAGPWAFEIIGLYIGSSPLCRFF
jgi:hypothetical protein